MKNSLEKKMEIDDSLVCHLALQSHSPQKSAINHYLDELYDIHSPQNEGKEKSFIAKQTIPQASVLAIDEEHKDLKLPSRFRRVGIFTVSLMLLILGLCGIFSPAKQAMTSAFRSVMSQPQTVTRYETKNIEDIRKDDQVLAYDVRTGEVTKRKVTQVFKRQADHIRYLTIRGENGIQQTVQTTDNHAFWVVTDKPDIERMAREMVTVENVGHEDIELLDENLAVTENGFYVEAKNLRVGDVFIGANDEQTTLTDTFREEFPNGITVYNFTVEEDHNYFVIANYEAFQNGAQPVLVHNSDCNNPIVVNQTPRKKGQRTDLLFNNKNDAMNWVAQKLEKNKKRIYDTNGKWIGWEDSNGDKVYWGHEDWYKGPGSSAFPHLNYNIGNESGHLFLGDKIRNTGLWDKFQRFFN